MTNVQEKVLLVAGPLASIERAVERVVQRKRRREESTLGNLPLRSTGLVRLVSLGRLFGLWGCVVFGSLGLRWGGGGEPPSGRSASRPECGATNARQSQVRERESIHTYIFGCIKLISLLLCYRGSACNVRVSERRTERSDGTEVETFHIAHADGSVLSRPPAHAGQELVPRVLHVALSVRVNASP